MNPKEYDITVEELYMGDYSQDMMCMTCNLKDCDENSPACPINQAVNRSAELSPIQEQRSWVDVIDEKF